MNHQTKNRNFGAALQASAILTIGMAVCTWLGSNMNDGQHVFQMKSAPSAGMIHLIKMPNAGASGLMVAPGIDDKFIIEMGKKGNAKIKNKQGTLRAAIYTMPSLKSANKKQTHIKDVII